MVKKTSSKKKKTTKKAKSSARKTESYHQISYIKKVRQLAKTEPMFELIHHVPNGNSGFSTNNQRMRSYNMGCLAGIPDIHIPLPCALDNIHGLYIEMKDEKGVLSDSQRAIRDKLRARGFAWELARSAEQALNITYDYIERARMGMKEMSAS